MNQSNKLIVLENALTVESLEDENKLKNKLVKGVKESDWDKLKALAALKHLSISQMIHNCVLYYIKNHKIG